jgi:hypothetical protein
MPRVKSNRAMSAVRLFVRLSSRTRSFEAPYIINNIQATLTLHLQLTESQAQHCSTSPLVFCTLFRLTLASPFGVADLLGQFEIWFFLIQTFLCIVQTHAACLP